MKLKYASAGGRSPQIRIINYARRMAMSWSRPLKLTGTWTQKVPRPRRLLGFLWSVPVGLQLSLVYALLLTLTLSLLGWALYNQLDGFLVQNAAQRLERFTRPMPVGPFIPGRDFGAPDVSNGPMSPEQQAADSLLRQLSRRSDAAMAVLDTQGKIILARQPLQGSDFAEVPPLPPQWAAKVKSGSVTDVTQLINQSAGGVRLLVELTPLTLQATDGSSSSTLYLEQIASLGAADALLNQLRFYILLGIIAGTAIGVVAGLLLTRAILRPLERMVRTAEAIAGGDLDRRLHLPAGRNEVARLGSSFDNMVDRLGAALQAQRRFVIDASHELRTPLTSLEGLSEMLLMGADRGDASVVQRMVRSMHGELGRLGRLVADLLTLSRLDSPVALRMVPTDVCRLLNEVSEQMSPTAEGQGIRLVTMCAEPLLVSGEPDRLKQVVLNLVDNALRYTPNGGKVLLSATPDLAKAQVQIKVLDTGAGIPPEDLPLIFDRFYRGDPSRARATGNTGLGLAIVRGIVETHNGTITVQSTVGQGTCFTITLPTLPSLPPAPPPPKAPDTQEVAAVAASNH